MPQRNAQVDLLCQIEEDYYALVEVQVVLQDFWDKRALAYAATIYVRKLSEGEKWEYLRKVICINLLGGGPKDTKWPERSFERFKFKNQHNKEIEDGIEVRQYPLFYPEIRQNKELLEQLTEKRKKEYWEWLDFFEGAHYKKEEDGQNVESKSVRKAYHRVKFSKLPQDVTEENLKQAGEMFAQYSHYTQYLQDQAKNEGIQEGVEKGKTEIAINMLRKGMALDMISEITHLSSEELEDLKKKIENL